MKNLDLLLNDDSANPWTMFDGNGDHKHELKKIVASASIEQIKILISKWDDHQMFNFMEDFICDGETAMTEQQYWDFIEESEL